MELGLTSLKVVLVEGQTKSAIRDGNIWRVTAHLGLKEKKNTFIAGVQDEKFLLNALLDFKY